MRWQLARPDRWCRPVSPRTRAPNVSACQFSPRTERHVRAPERRRPVTGDRGRPPNFNWPVVGGCARASRRTPRTATPGIAGFGCPEGDAAASPSLRAVRPQSGWSEPGLRSSRGGARRDIAVLGWSDRCARSDQPADSISPGSAIPSRCQRTGRCCPPGWWRPSRPRCRGGCRAQCRPRRDESRHRWGTRGGYCGR